MIEILMEWKLKKSGKWVKTYCVWLRPKAVYLGLISQIVVAIALLFKNKKE